MLDRFSVQSFRALNEQILLLESLRLHVLLPEALEVHVCRSRPHYIVMNIALCAPLPPFRNGSEERATECLSFICRFLVPTTKRPRIFFTLAADLGTSTDCEAVCCFISSRSSPNICFTQHRVNSLLCSGKKVPSVRSLSPFL